jgi:hypothetical protein
MAFKDQIRVLNMKVKDLESAKPTTLNIKDKIAEIKSEFATDLKGLGKELAIDIVALNKKIDSK